MGNRSKFIMGAATAVGVGIGVARRRRRARLRGAFDGIRESVMPSYGIPGNGLVEPVADESHAPGHRHLGPAPSERRFFGRRPLPRPFAKYHGFRHPV